MRDIGNLTTGRFRRSALLLVPVTLAALGVAGVTARPMMQLRDAQAGVDQALSNLERVEREAERNRVFEAARAQERLDAALAGVESLVPSDVSELDVHTAVRVTMDLHGLELQQLSVGGLYDAGFARGDDVVLLRPVEMTATGDIAEFFASLVTLESLGVPVTVLEMSIERLSGARFEVFATLGLCQRDALAQNEQESDPQAQGDSP